MEIIAEGKIEEAQLVVAEKVAQFETRIALHRVEVKRANLELENMQFQNEKARWEAEKVKYEAEEGKQKARIVALRGDLISKIIEELNFAEINMKQVFVLIEMVKDSQSPEDLLGAEAKWKQMKAQAS